MNRLICARVLVPSVQQESVKKGTQLVSSPFWTPDEEEWRKDPLAVLFMPELFPPNAAWPGKP